MQKSARILTVVAEWDPEAQVWVASSQSVPGLITEAETLEALGEKLMLMIPELLEANGVAFDPGVGEIHLNLIAHRDHVVALSA